jgi:transposase
MPLKPLCPDPASWRIASIAPEGDRLVFHLEPMRRAVSCPMCGTRSQRVHSRYRRKPWDVPWGQWPVQLIIHARRFFCDVPTCPRRIFVEPFPGVLAPYARQTARWRQILLELTHASNAEMAARVAQELGYRTSPDTLLRCQREEVCIVPAPRVLGVDEFALRRGSTYGTLLVDLERRQPVAVLEERSAEPLLKWLQAYPSVAILVRDRATAYALAGRLANPEIIQVADRFHLVCNVGDALKQLLHSQRWEWPQTAVEPPPDVSAASDPLPAPLTVDRKIRAATPRKRAAWEAVHQLRLAGQSFRQIARTVGLDRKTVRRYLAHEEPPVYTPRRARPTRLTPYLAYLAERWTQGCQNARQLFDELRQRGYRGCISQLRAAVHPWRMRSAPPPRRPSLARLILQPTRRLTDPERDVLERLLHANPLLAQGYQLKERFQALLAQRDVEAFHQWLDDAESSGVPSFHAVAHGFRQDIEAINAALTTPWSTGQCEGQICRVKLIKRLGYGRAKLDLLRQRILHRGVTLITRAGRGSRVREPAAA